MSPRARRSAFSREARSLLAFAVTAWASAGCVTPFSDFQSARTLAPGEFQLTPSFGHVQQTGDGSDQLTQTEVGFQAAAGLSDRVELRAKYYSVRLTDSEGTSSINVFGAGPKFALVPDQVALFVPLGVAFGSEIESAESLQIQPTLLFTIPLSDQVELNPSAKAHIWLNTDDDDADPAFSLNLGAAFSKDLSRWAVRPEVGLQFGNLAEFFHFGVGFSATIGERR